MKRILVTVSNTPTITTDAYTAGDSIGGLISLSTMLADTYDIQGSCYLDSVSVYDKGGATTNIDGFVFSSNPDSTTFTDNSTISINAADMGKISSCFTLESASYKALGSDTLAFTSSIFAPVYVGTDEEVYIALVERGTPTRSVGDLIFNFNLLFPGIA